MYTTVQLYSIVPKEIEKFLNKFFNSNIINVQKKWQHNYNNPLEMVDIIGAYIDNIDEFNISMWISLDADVFIKVTPDNVNELIKYMYERYPS
ncbi:MAG: hypothetical protein E7313_01145 [Clostridiales bacterium]|nr:hypothetical protein [Clostridiales bacterium]